LLGTALARAGKFSVLLVDEPSRHEPDRGAEDVLHRLSVPGRG